MSFDVPVAFIVFNRPEETARTFEMIRALRPSRLLIIADGPRNKPGEAELCQKTRAITEQIDWPCEVERNFSADNLGCKRRVSSGISWVFERVERAIILEDDCLPSPDFFPYCREMLDRYAADSRVMSIAGVNFQFGNTRIQDSYYFSRFNHIWGWASWRRAWALYNPDIPSWPQFRDEDYLRGLLRTAKTRGFFNYVFDQLYNNRIDTWDGQWTFAHFANRAACIVPRVNLIQNIGFGDQGTHTRNKISRYANMKLEQMPWPLSHPAFFAFHAAADLYTEQTLYRPRIPPALKTLIFKLIGWSH